MHRGFIISQDLPVGLTPRTLPYYRSCTMGHIHRLHPAGLMDLTNHLHCPHLVR